MAASLILLLYMWRPKTADPIMHNEQAKGHAHLDLLLSPPQNQWLRHQMPGNELSLMEGQLKQVFFELKQVF